MPSYETLCIFHPELPETQVKELGGWMQKIVEGAKGTVLQIDEWGMRDLAHLIRKQRRGYYVRLEYDAPGAVVKELERNLRINENVLRFLTAVRKVPIAAPTPQPAAAAPPTPPPAEAEPQADTQ
ncbi:MAG: 30S ribosomal protein S6 [Deltaproteobacteria bacterium]|nr:30S ribosomal protein S6 [Deltaproteobacteria bacterium]